MTKLLEGEITHPSSDGVVFGAGVCRRRLAELLERGLVAALRHPLGARGVPHGVASTIVLPHVLRWNLEWIEEKLARAEARLAPDTAREGSAQAARRFIRTVEDLVRSLQLPSRLRDVNVGRDDLMAIAQHAAHSFAVATNARPVEDPTQLADILERAW